MLECSSQYIENKSHILHYHRLCFTKLVLLVSFIYIQEHTYRHICGASTAAQTPFNTSALEQVFLQIHKYVKYE